MKRTLLGLVVMTCSRIAFAQGEIPVNMYTGRAGIFVNLYTLTDHDLSETITMSYNVNGVNLNSTNTYGVGWSVNVGGQVSREVRGLPDDFADATRTGWLYNNQALNISNFVSSADQLTSTCDEVVDQSFISNLQYLNDSEPDWFSFSVGGVSGHFVFNKLGQVSLVPYQDVLIVPTYSGAAPANKTIVGWTITTNDGVQYFVNSTCPITKVITKSGGQTSMSLYDREYNLYKISVNFNSAWMLTQTISPSGAQLNYNYNPTTNTTIDNKTTAFTYLTTSGSGRSARTNPNTSILDVMAVSSMVTTKTISSITTGTGMSAIFNGTTAIEIHDSARSLAAFKKFFFNQNLGFLSSIQEADATGCNQKAPYKFYYNNQSSYPSTTSPDRDFWGFYNAAKNSTTQTGLIPTIYVYPNEAGNERYRLYPIPSYVGPGWALNSKAVNRVPNPSAMSIGTLSRVVYPSGGESDFVFEANQYYDIRASMNQTAGGLRIKSVTYYDGVNPNANIVKTYSYVDANGKSTGRLINRPSFAIPVWQYTTPSNTFTYSSLSAQGQDFLWEGLTAISQDDLGTDDRTNGDAIVGYSHVSVTRPGSGYVSFDYYVPAAYGDASTGTNATDWSPTTMKFARPSNCPSMNIITKGETYGYPAFPSSYYDYERGLLLNKAEYNNNGTLVRNTQTTYQYLFKTGSTQPTSVVGLAYERFANSTDPIFLFGQYTLLADVAKVVASETVTTYDENNSSLHSTESSQYSYASQYHRLMSGISKTTADGTVYGTNFSYTLDYPVSTGTPADTTMWMIQMLKNANQTNTVIEQISTVKLPKSSTVKTTGASLIKYRPFSSNRPLMKYQLASRPALPVTTFAPSSVVNNVFQNDTSYQIVNTVNEYDTYGVALSSTGEDRNTNGTLWGYGQRFPVAQFDQTRATSIAFSDFETANAASFALSGDFYGQGRTGLNGLYPSATLTRTISKPSNAINYQLAFWLKNQSGTTVTLQVTLKDANDNVLYINLYPCTLNGGNYQYFAKQIPVSGMPSTFKINITAPAFSAPAGGSSPSLLPLLDDVAFYPDYASLSSTTYDIPFGPNSVTDASGATSYTSYDPLGRLKFLSDQDGNIKQRFTYSYAGQVQAAMVASMTLVNAGILYINTPVQFLVDANTCVPGAVFKMDFADGNGLINIDPNGTPTITYTTIGPRTITLQVSHPSYGTKTTSITVNILEPLQVLIGGSMNGQWATLTADVEALDGASIIYQWQFRTTGTTGWNPYGTNSNAFTLKILTGTSIDIMCTVTASDGRVMDSNVMTFTY